jgi:hypothetical protein
LGRETSSSGVSPDGKGRDGVVRPLVDGASRNREGLDGLLFGSACR